MKPSSLKRILSPLILSLLLPVAIIATGCGDGKTGAGTTTMAASTPNNGPSDLSIGQGYVAPSSQQPVGVSSSEKEAMGHLVASDDTSEPIIIDIVENNFRSTMASPLSTFSIDVDAASYSNARGYLKRGQQVPASEVRIEELVNYFEYDYARPTDGRPFAFNTEVSDCPWNPQHRLVRVALQGKDIAAATAPPSNLVFLIDVSGSMESPDKLPLLKESFYNLIANLRPEDHVAIVTYAGSAGVVLPSTAGSEKGLLRGAMQSLESGGGTAGGAGIRLAYEEARKHLSKEGNNRVILATDGDFNVGVSSESDLVKLIEQERNDGIFLSVLGFGTGNFQDHKMEQLADNGNGNFYYIDGVSEGKRVLVDRLTATLLTIAKDVKLQIEFNPQTVAAYRLVGYENRVLAAADFDNDAKDAGELGAGHSVTAFYEIVPVGTRLKYQIDNSKSEEYNDFEKSPVSFASGDLMAARLRYKEPNGSTSKLIEHHVRDNHRPIAEASGEFRFAAAVAEWGLLLRGSAYAGNASFAQVFELAKSGLGPDRDGWRKEFLELLARTVRIYGERYTPEGDFSSPGVNMK